MEEDTQNQEELEVVSEDGRIDDKIAKLKRELEVCRRDKEEYLQGWQRAKADYVNLDKASLARQETAVFRKEEKIFSELLEIADSFEQAFAKEIPDSSWASGIKNIYEKVRSMLKRYEIEPIDTKGKKFDPNMHEALELVDAEEEKDDDMIVAELQKGYTIKGRILRPSKVKIAHYNKGE